MNQSKWTDWREPDSFRIPDFYGRAKSDSFRIIQHSEGITDKFVDSLKKMLVCGRDTTPWVQGYPPSARVLDLNH